MLGMRVLCRGREEVCRADCLPKACERPTSGGRAVYEDYCIPVPISDEAIQQNQARVSASICAGNLAGRLC
jgi:hypothetical protein